MMNKQPNYFSKKNKRKGQQNQIATLINNQQNTVSEEEILKDAEQFYKKSKYYTHKTLKIKYMNMNQMP